MTFKKGHKPFAGVEKGWFKKGDKKSPTAYSFEKDNKVNLGRHHTEETKQKMGLLRLGENNSKWAGDKVGYFGLHTWLNRHFPKPEFCQMCNKKPPRHIANMTGIYSRDFNNWQWLCCKCHINYDRRKK